MDAHALMRVALLALALLAHAPRAAAMCPYTLALPAAAAAADGVDEGWCSPFAFAGPAPPATCANVSAVPPGGVLSYGTCALPGAACTGATALSVRDAVSGAVFDAVAGVSLNSSVAELSQGCVLGVRCSYGALAHACARVCVACAPCGAHALRVRCHVSAMEQAPNVRAFVGVRCACD